jgi:hypothetical protein
MKSTKIIMGCALAAGLMAFAASAQASDSASSGNIVVGNDLYSPITVKVTVKYVDSKDKITSASATSKDLLNDLGFDTKQVKLCLGEDGDVYAVNKKNGSVVNISPEVEGYGMWVHADEQLQTQKVSGKDNEKVQYQSEGQLHVEFSSSSSEFDISGLYSAKMSSDYQSKDNTSKVSNSAKTSTLTGRASVVDLGSDLPASGSASGGGNGTLVDAS